jgi:hypothetical protein
MATTNLKAGGTVRTTNPTVVRLLAVQKMIPKFRRDIHQQIRSSLELSRRGILTPETKLAQYESVAFLYGEHYERRAAADDAALSQEVDRAF